MDSETIRSLLTFLGGLLAFLGAMLTFVHGRLKDAATEKARRGVVNWTLELLSLAFNLIGVGAVIFTNSYLFPVLSFTVAMAIRAALFLREPGPVRRAHIIAASVMTVVFTAVVTMSITFYFFGRFVGVLEKVVK